MRIATIIFVLLTSGCGDSGWSPEDNEYPLKWCALMNACGVEDETGGLSCQHTEHSVTSLWDWDCALDLWSKQPCIDILNQHEYMVCFNTQGCSPGYPPSGLSWGDVVSLCPRK